MFLVTDKAANKPQKSLPLAAGADKVPHLFSMASVFIIFLCSFSQALSGELREIDGVAEAFHHNLHSSDEMYLVRVLAVKSVSRIFDKDTLIITGIIEEVVYGERDVGSDVTFRRIYDFEIGDRSDLVGQLYYVPFYRDGNGDLVVDEQDPAWVTIHSKEMSEYVAAHRKSHNKSKQQGASPGTR